MRNPAEVWPLAYFLAKEMEARRWMAEDVAAKMKTGDGFAMDLFSLNTLLCVHEDGLLSGDKLFTGLARAFKVSEDYFRSLDETWRKNPAARVSWECPDELFGPESRRAFTPSADKQ